MTKSTQSIARSFQCFLLMAWLVIAGTFSAVGHGAAGSTSPTAEAAVSTSATAYGAPRSETATSGTSTGLSAEVARLTAETQKAKDANPDDATAAAAAQLLKQAGEQLRARDKFTSDTAESAAAVREAPAQLEKVKAELASDETSATQVNLPTTATADLVEQKLAAVQAETNALQQSLDKVTAEQQRRATRSEAIPQEMVEARRQHSEAQIALDSGPGNDPPLLAESRRVFAQARLQAADARTSALEAEQSRYQAREQLMPAARQFLSERIAANEALIPQLEDRLAKLRKADATATARQIKQSASETATSHPLVRSVASENTSISAIMNLGAVLEQQEKTQEQLRQVKQQITRTSATFSSLQTKFASVGYSDALGLILRKQRKELPDVRSQREELSALTNQISDVNLRLLETQDKLAELGNTDILARDIAGSHGIDVKTTAGRGFKNEIGSLLQDRREYLQRVSDAYDKLLQSMVELSASDRMLLGLSSDFKSFIDERIFWLPSTERISGDTLQNAASGFMSLARLQFLREYWSGFRQECSRSPVIFAAGGLIFLLILLAHGRWKARLSSTLQAAQKNRLGSFKPLAQSLAYAALYVLRLPAFLILLGLPFVQNLRVPVEVSSLADGLIRGGIMLWLMRFARLLVQRQGISEVFYVWPETSLKRLRQTFSVLTWVYVPAVVLVRTWENLDTDNGLEAARLVMVLALVAIAVYAFRLFWPRNSILKGTEFFQQGSLIYRFRYVLFIVVTGGPLILAIAAVMGYFYTTLELSFRLNLSAWVGFASVLLSETAFFWILVKRRSLAIQEARKRREQARAAMAQNSDADGQTSPDLPAQPAEPSLDIAAISQQAGKLVRVCVSGVFILLLWGIWADVLPALHYLDMQPLWSVSRSITEMDPVTGTVQTVEKLVPVTLANLLLAVLVIVGAFIALRNIPGLLDISIYHRYKVQTGEKYAFNTLIRYVLIILASVYVLYLLGLQWKQIQWLLAGVSVGLGFGLQEIFANFVSGVILLFERPVRVGDVVTVGDQSGRVLQIRIRATTVINWDHRILIIPNKELITKSVLNWTLINSMTRLVITISVAHGADFDKARELLLKAAKDCRYVMSDPGPAAAIDKSTVTSVDFMLLAHLPNGDNAMDAKHEIIAQIEREFKSAGIALARPDMVVELQRDPIRSQS